MRCANQGVHACISVLILFLVPKPKLLDSRKKGGGNKVHALIV